MFSSHQAVKLEVVGHLFFEKWCFWIVFERPMALENWGNWGKGFTIGDAENETNPYNVLVFAA